MKKKLTLSIDEDVYEKLQRVPRGFSVSEFVSFMLRGMLREMGSMGTPQDHFEEWVNSDPERKSIREAVIEAWGRPTLRTGLKKIDSVTEQLKAPVGVKKKSARDSRNK